MLLAGVEELETEVVDRTNNMTYPAPFPDARRSLGLKPKWKYRSLNRLYETHPESQRSRNNMKGRGAQAVGKLEESEYSNMYTSTKRTDDAAECNDFHKLLVRFYGGSM